MFCLGDLFLEVKMGGCMVYARGEAFAPSAWVPVALGCAQSQNLQLVFM
jgi:hypothetical protein